MFPSVRSPREKSQGTGQKAGNEGSEGGGRGDCAGTERVGRAAVESASPGGVDLLAEAQWRDLPLYLHTADCVPAGALGGGQREVWGGGVQSGMVRSGRWGGSVMRGKGRGSPKLVVV